jgi:hypothetical protein
MLSLALWIQLLELLGWSSLWLKLRAESKRDILLYGKPQPKRIPIVDSKLQQLAGAPTPFQRRAADKVIKLIRGITNTKAFEHLVLAFTNSKSPMREKVMKPAVVVRIV